MLVLSRKNQQKIIINDDITITVVEIRGDKVRLGVEAPNGVPVHRHEIHECLKEQGRTHIQSQEARPAQEAVSG